MKANRRSPFGITLRQLREAAGFSQEQLAERAGLSLRGISDLERGLRVTPRLDTVTMLAAGLGLDDAQRAALFAARNANHLPVPSPRGKRPSRVPFPPTSFVGREEEIHSIVDQFENQETRLLTLVGPGGIGKTRIAIEAAHRLVGRCAEEAIFVDLSPIRNPEMVVAAIADRLGVPAQPGRDIRDLLTVAMQGRSLLVVLDNLEQVVDAAIDIARLLTACPDVIIIATSRVLLHLAAEHVVHIEPMTLPADRLPDSLDRSEAVSLFVARARAADNHFTLDHENAATVAALVTRLQGMPLAIELAAARIRLLSIPNLLSRLDLQLLVLTGGARDAPERHRTMRDTIAWSYDLLSPAEQSVFRTLSVFPDGCTMETAVAVMGVDGHVRDGETLAAVESLVESSLLRKRDGSDGNVRFRMLQTVREYGLEQLVAANEEMAARRKAHHAWCIPLARRAEFLMAEPDEVYWLNRISAEYQNVRHHIAWLVENHYIDDALVVSGSLALFRVLRWHMEEGKQELENLIAYPLVQERSLGLMKGCLGLGLICNHQGDFERALEVSRTGLSLARDLGDPRTLAWALNITSIALFYTGQIDEAESLYWEEAEVARSIDDSFFIQCTMHGQAAIADHRGQPEESRQLLQDVLRLCQEAGHVWGTALCQHNLGFQCIRRGELEEAERLVLEAQQGFAELEGSEGSPGLYLTLADIARLRNDPGKAASMLEKALVLARENGSIHDIAYSQLGLARISTDGGDLAAAQEHTYNAIQWYEHSGSAIEVVRCLISLSDIADQAHQPSRVAWCSGAAEAVLEQHGIHRTEIDSDEHRLRTEKVKSRLGGHEWSQHYDRGHLATIPDILAEVRSWQ